MPSHVYRYKLLGPSSTGIQTAVGGAAITVGDISPTPYRDITADSTQLADLSDYMLSQGWTLDSTDPASTIAVAQAATNTSQVSVLNATALVGKRSKIDFVNATSVVDDSGNDKVVVTLPVGSGSLASTAPTTIQAGDTAAVGVGTSAARDDHTHGLTTALAAAIANVDASVASAGSATSVARGDHKHNISTGNAVAVGSANAAGSGTALSLANHVHDHGSQSVGTMHAAVIASSTNGFMTGTDKAKLDAVPAGATTQVQFNDAGTLAGNAGLVYDKTGNGLGMTGYLQMGNLAVPSTPAAGFGRVFMQSKANRSLLSVVAPSGVSYPLQPSLFSNAVAVALPGSGTAMSYFGMPAGTVVATASHPALANTNLMTSMKRTQYATTTTAGNSSSWRGSFAPLWRGNAAGLGGFYVAFRWGASAQTATQIHYVGLWASTAAPTATTASSALAGGNFIVMGKDNGDANLFISYSTSPLAATRVNLTAAFPNDSTSMFDFIIYAPPNGSTIDYLAVNLNTGATASAQISTNLPQNTVFLNTYAVVSNNATAAAASIQLARVYMESDL